MERLEKIVIIHTLAVFLPNQLSVILSDLCGGFRKKATTD